MVDEFRDFIKRCDEMGDCQVVEGADWDLEIGRIMELVASVKQPPLLLFDKIKGYPAGYRVVTNMTSTTKRIAMALDLPLDLSEVDLVKTLRVKLREGYKAVPPIEVKSAPVKENIHIGDEVDLLEFPVPKWHELDGGRYIGTGDIVIQRDPDTGWINLGTYRVQVFDKSTATISIIATHHGTDIARKYWERGQACPTVVVCGQDPLLWITGTTSLPWGVNEYDYAGWLRGRPIEVVRGETVDLPIPATAEIALEGEFVSPETETRVEGPFAEWEGYYSNKPAPKPVFRVKAILHRNNPILYGAPPMIQKFGYDYGRHIWLAANLWNELDKHMPGLISVWQYPEARDCLMTVVSIKQMYAGHAKQAAMLVGGTYQGMQKIGRLVVVVDDDIDPSNISDVLWALATRWDPATQTDIIADCSSMGSDPLITPAQRESRNFVSSRAHIYACKPYSWIDKYPPSIKSSPEVLEETARKWGKLLFGKET